MGKGKQIFSWIDSHAGTIQAVVAVVMMISLWQSCNSLKLTRQQLDQNAQTIEITQRQVEASIDPVVEISHLGLTNTLFQNSGKVAISDFRLVGYADGFFNTNHALVRGDYASAGAVLKSKLAVGESVVFNHQGFVCRGQSDLPLNELTRVTTFVFQYKREIDRKPYRKTLSVMSVTSSGECFMFIMDPLYLSSFGGTGKPLPPWRPTMKRLLEEQGFHDL